MDNFEGCGLPQTERRGDWMQTYTGRQYWPLDPRASEVDIADIAHHLSMICRYCGACRRFYSVAEHSVGVMRVARAEAVRWRSSEKEVRHVSRHALMHDAAEAYCHDLIRPIKRCISGYTEIEGLNFDAIATALDLGGLPSQWAHVIKSADNAMLLAEQGMLMAPAPAKWSPIDVPQGMLDDAREYVNNRNSQGGWNPAFAKQRFLEEWAALA